MANPLRGPLRPGAMILMTGLLIGLSGCAQFPELDAVQTPGIEQAPYPALVSLDATAMPTSAPGSLSSTTV